jgi:hypothetical protein
LSQQTITTALPLLARQSLATAIRYSAPIKRTVFIETDSKKVTCLRSIKTGDPFVLPPSVNLWYDSKNYTVHNLTKELTVKFSRRLLDNTNTPATVTVAMRVELINPISAINRESTEGCVRKKVTEDVTENLCIQFSALTLQDYLKDRPQHEKNVQEGINKNLKPYGYQLKELVLSSTLIAGDEVKIAALNGEKKSPDDEKEINWKPYAAVAVTLLALYLLSSSGSEKKRCRHCY